jgi:hypothetical protein
MLHNCTYGYAIGVFINGRPMKKRDADYTLLQRQFMTAHKPAVPQSFLSTMTAPTSSPHAVTRRRHLVRISQVKRQYKWTKRLNRRTLSSERSCSGGYSPHK